MNNPLPSSEELRKRFPSLLRPTDSVPECPFEKGIAWFASDSCMILVIVVSLLLVALFSFAS